MIGIEQYQKIQEYKELGCDRQHKSDPLAV